MEYLLDTNICIYIIKKKPIEVLNKLRSIPLYSVAVSSITVAELEYGVRKSTQPQKNQEALNEFLSALTIVDFNSQAAVEYGAIRTQLEAKGTPIGSLDMLIAAHAKAVNLTLVTNNEREFSRIEGLKIENWLSKKV